MEEGKKVSKFSSGLNIIMRIDFLWKNCQNFKRNGNFSMWNEELDTIWLELARNIDEKNYKNSKDEKTGEEIEGYESKFNKYDIELKKVLPFIDFNHSFKKLSNEAISNRSKQYEILKDKQLFLARLENELDMGTTYEDEEDEDF